MFQPVLCSCIDFSIDGFTLSLGFYKHLLLDNKTKRNLLSFMKFSQVLWQCPSYRALLPEISFALVAFIRSDRTMKFAQQSRPNGIEVSVWQLVAILVAAIGCLFALVPLVSQYRSSQCKVILVKDTIVPPAGDADAPLNDHRRYVRQAPADQCSVVPPMCPAITTAATGSSTVSTTTRRSTVSTVSATRPVITAATTTRRTTTPNPWANTTRPYDSWRLPSFAVPIDYTLRLSCPDCFTLVSAPATMLFYGQLTMRINVLAPTSFLVLHAKNLNIARPTVTSGGPSPVNMTYLPEFEMVHLSFGASALPAGVHSIQINYTGLINQQDQTGFYRDTFWKSLGESS